MWFWGLIATSNPGKTRQGCGQYDNENLEEGSNQLARSESERNIWTCTRFKQISQANVCFLHQQRRPLEMGQVSSERLEAKLNIPGVEKELRWVEMEDDKDTRSRRARKWRRRGLEASPLPTRRPHQQRCSPWPWEMQMRGIRCLGGGSHSPCPRAPR